MAESLDDFRYQGVKQSLAFVLKLVATLARAWKLRHLLQKTHALGERGYVRGGVLGQSLFLWLIDSPILPSR